MKIILFSLITMWIFLFSGAHAKKMVEQAPNPPILKTKARNVIYFIGDGMGPAIVTATRIYHYGAQGKLHLENLSFTGFSKTYSNDDFVTDSAASGTALSTGHKTDNGVLGLGPRNSENKREILENLIERATKSGKMAGIVTTARVTHATPAAFYAHIDDRDNEAEIANFIENSKVNLILGGGRSYFYPASWIDPVEKEKGLRTDNRNIVNELKEKGWQYVEGLNDFNALEETLSTKVIGLFSYSHMPYEVDEQTKGKTAPSLSELVDFSIKKLSKSPHGFVLVVEGGRIDHASHSNLIRYSIEEMKAFDDAIKKAMDSVGDETLIIVTADHETGGIAINGGDPEILHDGKKLLTSLTSAHNKKRPSISWGTGPSGNHVGDSDITNEFSGTHAAYSKGTGVHTAIDVPIVAGGAGAVFFSGYMSNVEIFQKIVSVLGI